MSLQPSPCLQTGEAAAAPQPAAGSCPVKCRQRNRFIPVFLAGTALLSAASLVYLGIDWGKMLSRVPDIGVVFWDLAHLDFANMDLIFSSLVETISIAVLSLLYSLVLGVVFGMLAARNVFRLPGGAHPGLGAADAGLPGHGPRSRRGRALRPHHRLLYQEFCPEF